MGGSVVFGFAVVCWIINFSTSTPTGPFSAFLHMRSGILPGAFLVNVVKSPKGAFPAFNKCIGFGYLVLLVTTLCIMCRCSCYTKTALFRMGILGLVLVILQPVSLAMAGKNATDQLKDKVDAGVGKVQSFLGAFGVKADIEVKVQDAFWPTFCFFAAENFLWYFYVAAFVFCILIGGGHIAGEQPGYPGGNI